MKPVMYACLKTTECSIFLLSLTIALFWGFYLQILSMFKPWNDPPMVLQIQGMPISLAIKKSSDLAVIGSNVIFASVTTRFLHVTTRFLHVFASLSTFFLQSPLQKFSDRSEGLCSMTANEMIQEYFHYFFMKSVECFCQRKKSRCYWCPWQGLR